jgi:predicted HTH transcriptional regulator
MAGIELSETRRMERIGELLARAISRKVRREALEAARRHQPEIPENADPLLIFLSQVGEATPKEIRERFALSRSTAFRRLDALVALGKLTKHGNTRNIRYRPACLASAHAA